MQNITNCRAHAGDIVGFSGTPMLTCNSIPLEKTLPSSVCSTYITYMYPQNLAFFCMHPIELYFCCTYPWNITFVQRCAHPETGALGLSRARGISPASALPVSWSVREKCSARSFLSVSTISLRANFNLWLGRVRAIWCEGIKPPLARGRIYC